MRLLALLLLLLALTSCEAACRQTTTGLKAHPPAEPKTRLTLATTSEPSSLCPLFSDGGATAEVQGLLFRELVVATADGKRADLAARVPALGDGAVVDDKGRLVVDWFLRDDAFWDDGTAVSAADVVAGYKVAVDDALPVTTGRDQAKKIESVVAVDAHHVRVVWKEPQPSFADQRQHRVLPAHLVLNPDGSVKDIVKSGFCRRPVGNGAFALKEVKEGAYLLFAPNEHHVPRAKLDELVVKIVPSTDAVASALLAGDVDASFAAGGLGPVEAARVVDGHPALHVLSAPGSTWIHLDFRLDDDVLKDVRVRDALARAVDRGALVDVAGKGSVDVDDSFFPPQHWAHVAVPKIVFDPAAAEQLLDDAGWKRPAPGAIRVNAKGAPLHLELAAASGQKETERVLQAMQAMWRVVGVDVALDLKPFKVFFGENAKKRKIKQLSFYAWTVDESSMATNLWRADRIPDEQNGWSGQNLPGWKNDEVTRLLTEVDATLDTGARKEKLAIVQRRFREELPALSFWFRRSVVVVSDGVGGMAPTGTLTPTSWNSATWTKTTSPTSSPPAPPG